MNRVAAQRVSVTTADGLALVTRQFGPKVADMTVILLHGLLGDRNSWRCQTRHLTSRHPDIRVIAYDQRGHGRSGRGCALSNTIGQLARDLDAVIDTTTGQVHFDNFNGAWGDQAQLDRFLQIYAVERTRIEARKKGHQITEQALADGSIKLTITVGGGS